MACDNYRIDMTAAAFGQCKCGAPKSEHVMTSAGGMSAKAAAQRRASAASPSKPVAVVARFVALDSKYGALLFSDCC